MLLPPPTSSFALAGTSNTSSPAICPPHPDRPFRLSSSGPSLPSSDPDPHLWAPTPAFIQAHQFHPDLHPGHPIFAHLPFRSQQLLCEHELQSERWNHKPYFRDGVGNRRIALLGGYQHSERLVSCMMIPVDKHAPKVRPYFRRCCLPNFCDFCAYIRGQHYLKKFAYAWEPGAWNHVTVSIRGFVQLSAGLDYQVLRIWNALRGVASILARWCCRGVFGWEELSVGSLFPEALVGPHVHALLYAPGGLDESKLRAAFQAGWIVYRDLPPFDIRIESSLTSPHFLSCLRYVKPIDLLTPYATGFALAREARELCHFHQNVNDVLWGLDLATTEFRRFLAKKPRRVKRRPVARTAGFHFGQCHGSSKSCLATPADARATEEHQDAVRQLCREAWNLEGAERSVEDLEKG